MSQILRYGNSIGILNARSPHTFTALSYFIRFWLGFCRFSTVAHVGQTTCDVKKESCSVHRGIALSATHVRTYFAGKHWGFFCLNVVVFSCNTSSLQSFIYRGPGKHQAPDILKEQRWYVFKKQYNRTFFSSISQWRIPQKSKSTCSTAGPQWSVVL